MSWATSPPRLPILKLGHGFQILQDYCMTETAMFVFGAIAALTIAMEHYLEGEPAGLSLGALSKIEHCGPVQTLVTFKLY